MRVASPLGRKSFVYKPRAAFLAGYCRSRLRQRRRRFRPPRHNMQFPVTAALVLALAHAARGQQTVNGLHFQGAFGAFQQHLQPQPQSQQALQSASPFGGEPSFAGAARVYNGHYATPQVLQNLLPQGQQALQPQSLPQAQPQAYAYQQPQYTGQQAAYPFPSPAPAPAPSAFSVPQAHQQQLAAAFPNPLPAPPQDVSPALASARAAAAALRAAHAAQAAQAPASAPGSAPGAAPAQQQPPLGAGQLGVVFSSAADVSQLRFSGRGINFSY